MSSGGLENNEETRRATTKEIGSLTTTVDKVEAVAEASIPTVEEDLIMVEDSREVGSITKVVASEEAVAMTNTFRVMQVPLQPTRLDSQDGNQHGIIIIIIMIRDCTTLIRDGIDNQLQRETLKASCLTQLQP